MREFEKKYAAWIIRLRWPIILLSLVLVVLAASGGKYLNFTTNYRVFFGPDNPQLLAFDALERTYTKNDNVMFVVTPADGDVFTPDTLEAVKYLTERAWQTPYSIRVDSISNFQYTEAEQDDLIVRDLVGETGDLSQQDLAALREIALREPLLNGKLISPTAHVTAVNTTIQLPGKNETTEVPQVVSFVRDLVAEVEAKFPGHEVRLTGMVMMNNAFSEASQLDMKKLVPISFGLMLVMLALLLGGFTATFGTLLVIAFSIVSAMGIGGYLGLPITPPSASSPTIILTIAIANSVHVLVSFLSDMRKGHTKNAALIESLRINLQPVFLASATTVIGFMTMLFSEVPPFQHLGIFVAIGVAVSFLLAVTFLPALMSVLPVKVRPIRRGDLLMTRLGDFIVGKRGSLFWGMALLIVVLVSFLPRNELNDVFVQYFDESVAFRADSDYTTANITGLYTMEYSLESGEPGGISDPDFLAEVAAFSDWFRQQAPTMHVNSLTDIMKRLNKNMHGDDPAWYRLPDQRDLAAQYLLLYEMSLPYGLDLNNQINVDKSALRLTVTLQTMSTNELLALEDRAAQWLAENTRRIQQAEGTGPTLMFAHIGKSNIVTMLGSTTVALILISLILIVALRSLKIGMVSMVPNLVPAAMGFGLWGLLVGEIGLSLSIVAGMTLGIIVDDTVHFLSKYLRARREKGLGAEDAVRYAFTTVGQALITTSIVLIVGFAVLALSSFKLNSGMGTLSAIVITLALLADFLFLPPLLMKLEEKKDEKNSVAVTAAAP